MRRAPEAHGVSGVGGVWAGVWTAPAEAQNESERACSSPRSLMRLRSCRWRSTCGRGHPSCARSGWHPRPSASESLTRPARASASSTGSAPAAAARPAPTSEESASAAPTGGASRARTRVRVEGTDTACRQQRRQSSAPHRALALEAALLPRTSPRGSGLGGCGSMVPWAEALRALVGEVLERVSFPGLGACFVDVHATREAVAAVASRAMLASDAEVYMGGAIGVTVLAHSGGGVGASGATVARRSFHFCMLVIGQHPQAFSIMLQSSSSSTTYEAREETRSLFLKASSSFTSCANSSICIVPSLLSSKLLAICLVDSMSRSPSPKPSSWRASSSSS